MPRTARCPSCRAHGTLRLLPGPPRRARTRSSRRSARWSMRPIPARSGSRPGRPRVSPRCVSYPSRRDLNRRSPRRAPCRGPRRGPPGAPHIRASLPRSRTTRFGAPVRPAPVPRRAPGRERGLTSACANSDGRSGEIRKPVLPGSTTSGNPPTRVAITGRATDIASSTDMGKRLNRARQAHDIAGMHDVHGIRAVSQHAHDTARSPDGAPHRRRVRPVTDDDALYGRLNGMRSGHLLHEHAARTSLGEAPPPAPPRTRSGRRRVQRGPPRGRAPVDRLRRRLRSPGSRQGGSRRAPGAPSDSGPRRRRRSPEVSSAVRGAAGAGGALASRAGRRPDAR